ncbi:MAG TPA: hypothetical protein VJN92_06085, partial [Candidatus Acidoferrum sp.]|nr:hypothetical protein [Candidatus Acidoferrum sp.]
LFAVFSKAQRPGPGGPSNRPAPVQRILLLSIDGMHNLDLERLVRERPDQIYVDADSAFVAEHGGNTEADRNVPLVLSLQVWGRSFIKFPVQTSQIAPTILRLLGLNPNSLDAVRLEKTPLLPGLDFQKLSASQETQATNH